MKFLFLLPGLLFGAAEFFLTKATADRILTQKPFAVPLTAKLITYAAVVLPVVLCPDVAWLVPFGIGLGLGMVGSAFVYVLFRTFKGKR